MNTIFFDRDGVINDVVMRDGQVSSPRALTEFCLRSDFIATYEKIRAFDLRLFVVSNQPDISRSLLSEEILAEMTKLLYERFRFTEVVYCLHDNEEQCLCRKPKPGMLNYLVEKYNIDCSKAIFIGDSKKDVLAGASAGIRTVYLRQPHNQELGCEPDFVVDRLVQILPILGLI